MYETGRSSGASKFFFRTDPADRKILVCCVTPEERRGITVSLRHAAFIDSINVLNRGFCREYIMLSEVGNFSYKNNPTRSDQSCNPSSWRATFSSMPETLTFLRILARYGTNGERGAVHGTSFFIQRANPPPVLCKDRGMSERRGSRCPYVLKTSCKMYRRNRSISV